MQIVVKIADGDDETMNVLNFNRQSGAVMFGDPMATWQVISFLYFRMVQIVPDCVSVPDVILNDSVRSVCL